MRSRVWWYKVKGYLYSYGPVRFEKAIGARRFREYLREHVYKVDRLVGVEVYPGG